jgi:hypothetical protein
MRRTLAWLGFVSLLGCGTLGCGSKGNSFENDGSADDDGGNADEGGIIMTGDSGSDGPGCDYRCSADLHSVIDCNGKVVNTCTDTQGCDPTSGGCVPACESAKKNRGSVGCEFYALPPNQGYGSCFAVYVANTWSSPVTLTANYQNQNLPVGNFARIPSGNGASITYNPLPNGQLPAGQVAILFMRGSCPGGTTPPATGQTPNGTGMGDAMRVASDRPVSAYDIYPYGGGNSAIASATLLLPTSAWDTNYVAVSPYDVSTVTNAPGAVSLAAFEDGTKITILPKVAIVGGGGVNPGNANVPASYTLNKGQVITFAQTTLLDGSPIQSTKPIGMWASMSCFNVPKSTPYCDSAHQQVPPVQALGSEYALVRYRNRIPMGAEETPPWRLLGLVDGTTLTWEPTTPMGAPTTLNAGQLVIFMGSGPYIVKAQDEKHPFYVSSHMTGCNTVGTHGQPPVGCAGDAEYVNVVPAKEFENGYVFFTDPTYPESNLVIVRSKASGQFHDVTLDCAGVLGGWQPVGTSGQYEYTRKDLVTGNFAKVGNCDNGRREIHSDGPFGLTVWGWGTMFTQPNFFSEAVSYGYPGGMSLRPINTVVIPPTPK